MACQSQEQAKLRRWRQGERPAPLGRTNCGRTRQPQTAHRCAEGVHSDEPDSEFWCITIEFPVPRFGLHRAPAYSCCMWHMLEPDKMAGLW